MSKERNSPASLWRFHQEALNPCDPQDGAFSKIWQRQQKENGHSFFAFPPQEENQEKEEVNIPIPADVFDTKESVS